MVPPAPMYQDKRTGEHYYWDAREGCYIYTPSGRRQYPNRQQAATAAASQPVESVPRTIPSRTGRQVDYDAATLHSTSPGSADYVSVPNTAGACGTVQTNIDSITRGLQTLGVNTQPEQSTTVLVQESPKDKITDPELYNRYNVEAHLKIKGAEGEYEVLDPRYVKQRQPDRFFVFGRVFRMLWSEPSGDRNHTTVTEPRFRTGIHSKVRRFVVIRAAHGYCSCIPILTYGGRGVAKPNVQKSEHAVAHTTQEPPKPLKAEMSLKRGEQAMRDTPIRITAGDVDDELKPESRIHFGKVYTVEHNVKVCPSGVIHQQSMDDLRRQFLDVWADNILPKPRSQQPIGGQYAQSAQQTPQTSALRRQQSSSSTATQSTKYQTGQQYSYGKQPMNYQTGQQPQSTTGSRSGYQQPMQQYPSIAPSPYASTGQQYPTNMALFYSNASVFNPSAAPYSSSAPQQYTSQQLAWMQQAQGHAQSNFRSQGQFQPEDDTQGRTAPDEEESDADSE